MGRLPLEAAHHPMEGWHGWDAYAPYYDWENARTMGRRDVPFWEELVRRTPGTVLELGCGTGRVSLPVARVAHRFVGVDRSSDMLRRARTRLRRARGVSRASLVRADIRVLPFDAALPFQLVIAPYGILQSLLSEHDLMAALRAASRVLARGGTFGIELVPDLPRWTEYDRRVSLRGRRSPRGSYLTLVESVRQDPQNRLTIFDQEYVERLGARRTVRRFSLAFRTTTVSQMTRQLAEAHFRVDAVLGDYTGRPWTPGADVWLLVATRT